MAVSKGVILVIFVIMAVFYEIQSAPVPIDLESIDNLEVDVGPKMDQKRSIVQDAEAEATADMPKGLPLPEPAEPHPDHSAELEKIVETESRILDEQTQADDDTLPERNNGLEAEADAPMDMKEKEAHVVESSGEAVEKTLAELHSDETMSKILAMCAMAAGKTTKEGATELQDAEKVV